MPSTTIPTFAGVDSLPMEYVWASPTAGARIPKGCVTIIYGEGSVGKGRMIWESLIGPITTGRPLPFCTEPTEVGSVVVILPEDNLHEQQAARLESSGADPSRVIPFTRLPGGAKFKLSADTTHEGDAGQLRALIEAVKADPGMPDVSMVYIDPVAAVVGWGSIQTNAGARRLIEPLEDIAEATGISILLVAHPVSTNGGTKLQGSMGLEQAARLIYRVSYDKANPHYRVLEMVKHNNIPKGEDLRFTVETIGGLAKCVWIDGEELDKRMRGWRQPSYRAAVSLKLPDVDAPVIRPLGMFLSVEDAQLACSAAEEAPGPALDGWHQHDAKTVATSVTREDGTLVSFAIARTGGPEIVTAQAGHVKAVCEHPDRRGAAICGDCPRRKEA